MLLKKKVYTNERTLQPSLVTGPIRGGAIAWLGGDIGPPICFFFF